MIESAFTSTGVDSSLLPFGRIQKTTLLKAKKILDELE